MEKLKLTVQLVDADNEVRLTEHRRVTAAQARATAGQIVERMAGYFRKEQKATSEE